jgi:hypothetical protein
MFLLNHTRCMLLSDITSKFRIVAMFVILNFRRSYVYDISQYRIPFVSLQTFILHHQQRASRLCAAAMLTFHLLILIYLRSALYVPLIYCQTCEDTELCGGSTADTVAVVLLILWRQYCRYCGGSTADTVAVVLLILHQSSRLPAVNSGKTHGGRGRSPP